MDIRDVLVFAANELKINDIVVEITTDDIDPGESGYSYQIDEQHYVIGLNKNIRKSELLKTIFHEMAHIHQQFEGRYVVETGFNGRRLWDGIEVTVPYDETPWEIDATAREGQLYGVWISENKLENFKWTKRKSIHVI